jgi:hypothetical protein
MIAVEVAMLELRQRPVALASAAVFVLGFFGLAARGAVLAGDASPGLFAIILAGATVFAGVVLALTLLFAAVETVSGRAWALGFRRLAPGEATKAGIASRALRYATFLWLCNGAAFFVAGFR